MTTEFQRPDPTLRAYLMILRRQRWWLIGCAVLGLAASLAVSLSQPKQYSATAQVLLQPVGAPGQAVTPTDVQTDLQLVTSAPVRGAVERKLGSVPDVTVSEVQQTNVIAIEAAGRSPASAARVANAYARAFVAYQQAVTSNQVTAAEEQLRTQISSIARQLRYRRHTGMQESALLNQEAVLKQQLAQAEVSGATASGGVTLVTPAVQPASPSSPKPVQDGLLGLAAGLLLGMAAAFVANNLADTLSSKEAVEHIGDAPVLAMVPMVTSWKRHDQAHLVSRVDPTSPAAEAYRSLRTSLQFAQHERQIRTLVVTSPAKSEGKSSAAANLGWAFADAGERVVLVSCDLRKPRIGQFFGIDEKYGLTTVLLGEKTLSEVLQPVPSHDNLWVLGSGAIPHNPADLLSRDAVREVFATLRAQFGLVLIDSPPILPVTDPVVLSTIADATLLIVAAGQTKGVALRRAAEKLAQVNAFTLGIVLNEVTKQAGYGYGYGYGQPYGYRYKSYPPALTDMGTLAGNGRHGGEGYRSAMTPRPPER